MILKTKPLPVLLGLIVNLSVAGQTQIYLEDFESSSVNYSTSVAEFSDGSGDFFIRTDGSDITGSYSLNNLQGSYFFGAMDLDGQGATLPLNLTTNSISISGYINLEFRVYLAEDDDGTNEDWDDDDYLHITYSIDGNASQNLLWVEADGISSGTNVKPSIDTDFDGVGDGTEVTENLVQFTKSITGTGANLTLDFEFNMDSGDEDIAIDHIEVYGVPGNPPPDISNIYQSPTTPSSSEMVNLFAEVTDQYGIDTVYARWSTTSGNLTNTIGMSLAQNDTFETTTSIPAQSDSTTVYYLIVATDANGTPATDSSAEQSYSVYDFPTEDDAWINELHYDNAGSDQDEMVEIVIKDTTEFKLQDFNVLLYNGSDGGMYDDLDVTDTLSTSLSYGSLVASYDATGIQNGDDGIALVFDDTALVQFLSYEGAFSATDGAASGDLSVDIGVSESASPVGESLQLLGAGISYSDFEWQSPAASTSGLVNNSQLLRDPFIYEFNGSWNADPSGVSTQYDSIVVTSGDATISSSTSAKSLRIAPGATLDLGMNTLTLSDTAVLEADAAGYAQIKGEIEGWVTHQTHLSSTESARWFNVGFPVKTTLDTVKVSNGGFINTLAQSNGGNDTGQVNIWYYNAGEENGTSGEGSWEPVDDKTQATEHIGYSIYLGAPYFGSLPQTISATGRLINGDQTISLDNSLSPNQYNFIPNPFASAIDWDMITDDNPSINQTYYIFDGGGDSIYRGYNASAGTPVNGATQYIAPGQAFYVNAGSATSIDILQDTRALTQTPAQYKTQKADGIFLSATTAQQNQDYTYIGFKPGALDSFNQRYDGHKRLNTANTTPNIYSDFLGKNYMYKFISPAFPSRSIPVSFSLNVSGNVSIEADFRNIDPSWTVKLEDLLTGTYTDLRNGQHSFNHHPSNQPERFVLHIGQQGVGQRESQLAEFYAYMNARGVLIIINPSGQKFRGRLIDISGRLVMKINKTSAQRVELNLSDRLQGLYLLRLSNDQGKSATQKVMVH